MIKYILYFLSLIVLTSCTFGDKKVEITSPYPSVPLGVSLEIHVPKNTPLGHSYKANGMEPFWAVDVTPGKAIFSRPGETDVKITEYSVTEDDKGAIIVIKGVKGDFFLNMIKGPCSDGMSDTKYTYKATLLVGSESLEGCASGAQ